MNEKLRIAGFLAILVLAVQALSWGQKNSTAPTAREWERQSFAQNLARAINAAESDYFKQHQVYASWDTLVGVGDFSSTGTRFASSDFPTVAHALYGNGPEIVPGWRLRLLLGNKDKAYDVLLEDVTDQKCGYAVFTDERGAVRQGKSISCPL